MEFLKSQMVYVYGLQLNKLILHLNTLNENENENLPPKIKVNTKQQAESLLNAAVDKLYRVKGNIRKQYLAYVIGAVIGYIPMNYIVNKFATEDKKEIVHIVKNKLKLKNVSKLHTSKSMVKIIKDHEKLKLRAYNIGDGKITIGYGVAYDENDSPYKVGDKISVEKAESLFRERLLIAENGVKRMFKQWHEEEDINIKLEQNQFDALVSICYNAGVTGFRKSELVQIIKRGDMKKAAEAIKNTLVSDEFSGLYARREMESKIFSGKYNS